MDASEEKKTEDLDLERWTSLTEHSQVRWNSYVH